eukprot:CAMPEP_0194143144 /NCGR_PEP_ID=MMETSP0152-20130528/12334_1 /TAXON_ID=1049557 /ORGANISM="Thalassiothrix antarctica, Strain L6-D1" /LENGTH=502 /DNA_ID=CAMNT_0038842413 /DNA_START=19 /DNA_END=1524 /DNA_ORIENTATION=+
MAFATPTQETQHLLSRSTKNTGYKTSSIPEKDGNSKNTSENDNDKDKEDEKLWSPSGNYFRDGLYFVGPGWLVCIAYVDPGNYQADIQAGASSRYNLLFAVWWSSLLSIYVQILCVRLSYYGQVDLAQVQAVNTRSNWLRYLNWFIAELSTIITDMPQVVGFAVACNYFLGCDYYVGVILSLVTTMNFLATIDYGIRLLETIVAMFVVIMAIALFAESLEVQPDINEIMSGWTIGFRNITSTDLFAITGILGSIVQPHNLYLHTAALCTSRKVERTESTIHVAIKYSSWELTIPIIITFFVNVAVTAVAAESLQETNTDENTIGLTNFCDYFQSLKYGCFLWAVSLFAAGQSGAITTTYTGQYVMDGFLNMKLSVEKRAIITRLVAITPCALVSAFFPESLNNIVNVVNSLMGFLLPFALTPLIKYNCSKEYMGEKYASKGIEKCVLYMFAFLIYFINAAALVAPGGGFFGDYLFSTNKEDDQTRNFCILFAIIIEVLYLVW